MGEDVLTGIELAGSAIVVFLYVAILASAMSGKGRRKHQSQKQHDVA